MQHSFSQLGVSAHIARTLAERNIHEPFPIQARVLPDALAGRDVLAKSPTGSGKTLSFAIPIVERLQAGGPRPAALVLVPTRELAAQVAGELDALAPGAAPCGRRLRRRSDRRPGQAGTRRAHPRRDAGSAERPARAQGRRPRRRAHPRPRRGRSHARHGLQAAGRPDRPQRAEQAADHVLLGDARQRGR